MPKLITCCLILFISWLEVSAFNNVTVEVNNLTRNFKLGVDETPRSFNVTIRGYDLNNKYFCENYRFNAEVRNVSLDIGTKLFGQVLDLCHYEDEIEIPDCNPRLQIKIPPLPIRNLTCAFRIDSVQVNYTEPEFSRYNGFRINLTLSNGTNLTKEVSIYDRSVTFVELEPGEYLVTVETQAGEPKSPNTQVSPTILCETIETSSSNPDQTQSYNELSSTIKMSSILVIMVAVMVISMFAFVLRDKIKMLMRKNVSEVDQAEQVELNPQLIGPNSA